MNALHNIVHLLFGVIGIAASRAFDTSRLFLIGGGVIYAVLWIYGLIIDFDSGANFVLNTPDNWLHFALAVGMIGLGVVLGRGSGVERGTRPADSDRLATKEQRNSSKGPVRLKARLSGMSRALDLAGDKVRLLGLSRPRHPRSRV